MRCAVNHFVVLIVILWPSVGNGSTWYVRPGVHSSWNVPSPAHPIPTPGVYGSQDGTSYANAWNGLESIVWGIGGVVSGDTLYVCGAHIYRLVEWNYPSYQAAITIDPSGSGCVIRGDYPGDPGIIFGGAFDDYNSHPFYGPDANGVYSCSSFWTGANRLCYEVNGTNITSLNLTNTTTWDAGLGSWFNDGTSNYVKTISGTAPTSNNIAANLWGWRFVLPIGLSNVTFQSCSFIGGGISMENSAYPALSAANRITFKDCIVRDCDSTQVSSSRMFPLEPGHDYWKFDGCDISYCPSAVYSGLGYNDGTNQIRGIIGLTVTNCYIHDVDTINYSAIDGHAVGMQGSSDCIVSRNQIERTGTAIALFSYSQKMSNNLIAWNFVKDIHWHNRGTNGNTGGEGIWISGSYTNTSLSNRVEGNIVLNVGLPGTGSWLSWMGSGISSSTPDYLSIFNNVVMSCDKGINVVVNSYPVNTAIENNIVVNATNKWIVVSGDSVGTVVSDYNLFWTNGIAPPSTPFYFTGSIDHDSHSLTNDPAFFSVTPSSSSDFRLRSTSPAIATGTPVGLSLDFANFPWKNPPSIGAYEYWEVLGVAKLRVTTLQGR